MADILIILIILVLLYFALKGSVKHFKGDGACCSGGSFSRTGQKNLDGPVMAVRKIAVSGMRCEKCAETVKCAIDSIDGAVAAVDLKSSLVTVRMDRTIDDIVLRKKVEDSGYTVVSITDC